MNNNIFKGLDAVNQYLIVLNKNSHLSEQDLMALDDATIYLKSIKGVSRSSPIYGFAVKTHDEIMHFHKNELKLAGFYELVSSVKKPELVEQI